MWIAAVSHGSPRGGDENRPGDAVKDLAWGAVGEGVSIASPGTQSQDTSSCKTTRCGVLSLGPG